MFKNPLKYASGGATPQQEQQIIEMLNAAAKNIGIDAQTLMSGLDQIKDTKMKETLIQALPLAAKGDAESINAFKKIFGISINKRGGKIQDFICKHGKGGAVAGCGCEKPVLKGQEAIPGGMPRFQAPTNYYNEKGWPISERDAVRRNNRTFYTEEPTTAGNLAWTNNQMSSQLMWPGVVQDVQYNPPVGHYIDEYGNMHNFAVQGEDLTRYNNRKAQWKGDGGKVEKAQDGEKTNDVPYNGTISQGKPRSKVSQAIDNNSKARNFVKGVKQFVKSPMVRLPAAGAAMYGGIKLAGMEPITEIMPAKYASFAALSQMRPKFILDTINPMATPEKSWHNAFWAIPGDNVMDRNNF